VEEAWKKLRGKEVVVECKFDGDRIQVHKNGNDIHFFSRCILDGEMLVWDRLTNRFAEFGSNQEIAKAAKMAWTLASRQCHHHTTFS
jgi:DNA ligase-4